MYRRLNKLSQERLAALLGYDKTYVSMIETGRRSISNVATRRHIACTLGLPMHALGVTDNDDADFAAMIQFGDSTIRLAEIARQSGRAVDAVNELWPLVARLEARAAEGRAERDTMILLGQGRAALGVSLGTVLPEERLTAAARWTGKALVIAERLGDRAFLAHALRMHGNELRKADHVGAAITRLSRAVAVSEDREGRELRSRFSLVQQANTVTRTCSASRLTGTANGSPTVAAEACCSTRSRSGRSNYAAWSRLVELRPLRASCRRGNPMLHPSHRSGTSSSA
ncbi:helix-turn-helix domain-containing protein [Lentzea sp.]|uniref:helix-turn-helix domain-containing protein n=1 Tax=Lentzea sp. TaxID=56099 RepID=UPI002C73C960|nr:helix-turn-helix domain-containing protein [Lentzea sp.]HUQ54331.1 helix-turn-helix domain-containing protein [Lentzea sp.]